MLKDILECEECETILMHFEGFQPRQFTDEEIYLCVTQSI